MAFQYFQIPAADGESAQAELNALGYAFAFAKAQATSLRDLAGKKVTRLEQHFVADGASSFWAVKIAVRYPVVRCPVVRCPG